MIAVEINHLLDAAIFNVAIGNVDSHAKNYSILLLPDGAKLAPFYDLMSGLAWTSIAPNKAHGKSLHLSTCSNRKTGASHHHKIAPAAA